VRNSIRVEILCELLLSFSLDGTRPSSIGIGAGFDARGRGTQTAAVIFNFIQPIIRPDRTFHWVRPGKSDLAKGVRWLVRRFRGSVLPAEG